MSKGKAKYERYRMLADEKGWSDYRTAKETGIAQETLSSWKNGKYVPKQEKLQILADKFDVDVDFFFEEDTIIERFAEENITPIVTKFQKLFEVSAGNGRSSSFPEDFKQEEGEVAKVVGDSMLPTLRNGDVVRIVETSQVTPADFALVRINGDELTVKHCEVTDDGVWVRGENPDAYEDKFYTVSECLTLPVQIVGKAIEIVSRKL